MAGEAMRAAHTRSAERAARKRTIPPKSKQRVQVQVDVDDMVRLLEIAGPFAVNEKDREVITKLKRKVGIYARLQDGS